MADLHLPPEQHCSEDQYLAVFFKTIFMGAKDGKGRLLNPPLFFLWGLGWGDVLNEILSEVF